MKFNAGQSFEEWAMQVKAYEYKLALKKIAQGKDYQQVMEDMSRRIVQKLNHARIVLIKNT